MGSCVAKKQVIQINSNIQLTTNDHSQRKSNETGDSVQLIVMPESEILMEKIKIKNQGGRILQKLQEKNLKKAIGEVLL